MDRYLWVSSYLAVPFKEFGRDLSGLDCWGLVCLVYKDVLGIALPLYNSEYVKTLALVCADNDRAETLGWVPIEKPEHLCIVGLATGTRAMHHVGIYLNVDGGLVLHAVRPRSCILKLDSLDSYGYHCKKFYRYAPTHG